MEQYRHGATAPWTRYRFRAILLYSYRSEPPNSGGNELPDRVSVGRRSTRIMKDSKETFKLPSGISRFLKLFSMHRHVLHLALHVNLDIMGNNRFTSSISRTVSFPERQTIVHCSKINNASIHHNIAAEQLQMARPKSMRPSCTPATTPAAMERDMITAIATQSACGSSLRTIRRARARLTSATLPSLMSNEEFHLVNASMLSKTSGC